MVQQLLPKQPPLIISYLKVGKLLYFSLLLFIAESWFFYELLANTDHSIYKTRFIILTGFFLFSFIHIFLVIMDGWSRFQNYKRIKDQLYIYGFHPRLVANYTVSKCQRNAAIIAATELGLENQIHQFYNKLGIRWFHFIPYFMIQDALFLFKKSFWSRTFLEKPYSSRFDFREIAASQVQQNQV